MVQVKRGHNGYIVFQDDSFNNHHAHVKTVDIANCIRDNVISLTIPKTTDISLLESHLRVATDHNYRVAILDRIYTCSIKKNDKRLNLDRLSDLQELRPGAYSQDLCTFVRNIVNNSFYQPYQISSTDISITLEYRIAGNISCDIVIYKKTKVRLRRMKNEGVEENYLFRLTSDQVCHLIRKLNENKFKEADYTPWAD